MSAGGTITIAAENVRGADDGGRQREFVRVSVTDTGVGMPPEVQARAFEPFFTTKGVSKGSGLGLPQVYGFAHQSDGRVTIDSTVGVGTVVTLLLPRSLKKPSATATHVEVASVPGQKTDPDRRGHVLLVEDDQEVAALTGELRTSLGFAVIRVAGADAALGALADSRSIDVVLSDVMMPGGMSGLQLAREIRRRHPGIPILLTTGYVESLAGMGDEEFEILPKPFTAEALAKALGIEPHSDAAAT